MSLKWSSYVALMPPKGGSITQNGQFPSKIALRLKKVCYKVSLCENCQRQSCKAFLALCKKWLVGATPSTRNSGSNWPRWSEIADFRYLYAHGDSAVTPSEKSSIKANRKSTTRFPMSPRWTSNVFPKPPQGGSKTQSVQNWNNKLR